MQSVWENSDHETIRRDLAKLDACPTGAMRLLLRGSSTPDISALSDNEVLRQVARQIERGTICAVQCDCASAVIKFLSVPSDDYALEASKNSATKNTWVEVVLVDADGEPVANEEYKLTLVDGRVLTGRLNDEGYVRVRNIDAGTCQLTFPNLAASTWKAA